MIEPNNLEGLPLEHFVAAEQYEADYKRRHIAGESARRAKHGHYFGCERRCACGLTEKDYHMNQPGEWCPGPPIQMEDAASCSPSA